MFQNLKTSVRQFLTALALLAGLILGLELFLRSNQTSTGSIVARTAPGHLQPLLVPSATVHHELARLRPAGDFEFATNSFGLRGAEPNVDSSQLRILFLGDDTVLGTSLAEEQTLPSRLQQFLTKSTGRQVEVINAGTPGYCPLLSWLQYRHQLRSLDADVIVLHFDMTDITDDAAYRQLLNTSGAQAVCINPSMSQNRKPWAMQLINESAIARTFFSSIAGQVSGSDSTATADRYQWTFRNPPDLRLRIQHALSPLKTLTSDVTADDATLIVSSTPMPWQLNSAPSHDVAAIGSDAPFRILSSACAAANIPFCNATPAFEDFEESRRLFRETSTELSPYGAALYARQIASMLLSSEKTAALFSTANRVSAESSTYQ